MPPRAGHRLEEPSGFLPRPPAARPTCVREFLDGGGRVHADHLPPDGLLEHGVHHSPATISQRDVIRRAAPVRVALPPDLGHDALHVEPGDELHARLTYLGKDVLLERCLVALASRGSPLRGPRFDPLLRELLYRHARGGGVLLEQAAFRFVHSAACRFGRLTAAFDAHAPTVREGHVRLGAPPPAFLLVDVTGAVRAAALAHLGKIWTMRTTPRTSMGSSPSRKMGPRGLYERSTTLLSSWYCFTTSASRLGSHATTRSPCSGVAPNSTTTWLPCGTIRAALSL